MSRGAVSISVFLAVAISACSPNQKLFQERAHDQAPASSQQVGVLLDGAKQDQVLNVLASHPKARVRVLNSEHGMYEIFGVSSETLKKEVDAQVSPNQFFQFPHKEHAKLFSVSAPDGLQVGDLAPCKDDSDTPTAVLTIERPGPLQSGQTFELGETLKITATKSMPAASTPSQLKTIIAVDYPEASGQTETIQDTDTLEFKPDTLGLYKIVVLVQDARNVCAMDGVQLIATANRPYAGKNVKVPDLDLSKFTHLAAVNARKSWDVSQGDGIVIAIIDSGVDYNHPSLAPNIYTNDKETPDNQIDDDNNGFVDDYLGYDFANKDAFPYDDDSHGTHVAGLAAGRQFGLAPHAKILPVKALSSLGGDIGSVAAAIRYATDRGANIINMSLGAAMPAPNPVLASAIDYAESKGVLVVVAAGNGDEMGMGYDIDQSPVYPASLPNENIVAVAASTKDSDLTPYSNYGAKSVDVVAPGGLMPDDPIYSAAFENPKGGQFLGMTGTSMATPIVTGIAAQVWSLAPRLTAKEVKQILLSAGTPAPALKTVTVSGRHIDALSAVDAANSKNVLF